jgi:hypothetical protein
VSLSIFPLHRNNQALNVQHTLDKTVLETLFVMILTLSEELAVPWFLGCVSVYCRAMTMRVSASLSSISLPLTSMVTL